MNNFTILKQFNYFQDDLLSSVGIRHTKEAGLRDCKIAMIQVAGTSMYGVEL